MAVDVAQLGKAIGVTFVDEGLLVRALTHRSSSQDNNERLEFLGDAILGAVIASRLYEQHPNATEGELTQMRSRLVRGDTLFVIAEDNGLSHYLRYGTGDCELKGMLADAVEAIIAAIYLDQGMQAAEAFIDRLFADRLSSISIEAIEKDAKTLLQEWAQARGEPLPVYTITTSGPPHQRMFQASCKLADFPVIVGLEASTRRSAEKAVAHTMLETIHDR